MKNNQIHQTYDNDITNLTLPELRAKWAEVWGYETSPQVGRKMLEYSLERKLRANGGKSLNEAQKRRIEGLVWEYKRNTNYLVIIIILYLLAFIQILRTLSYKTHHNLYRSHDRA